MEVRTPLECHNGSTHFFGVSQWNHKPFSVSEWKYARLILFDISNKCIRGRLRFAARHWRRVDPSCVVRALECTRASKVLFEFHVLFCAPVIFAWRLSTSSGATRCLSIKFMMYRTLTVLASIFCLLRLANSTSGECQREATPFEDYKICGVSSNCRDCVDNSACGWLKRDNRDDICGLSTFRAAIRLILLRSFVNPNIAQTLIRLATFISRCLLAFLEPRHLVLRLTLSIATGTCAWIAGMVCTLAFFGVMYALRVDAVGVRKRLCIHYLTLILSIFAFCVRRGRT